MWNEFEHVEDDRFDPNRDGYYGEYRDYQYGYDSDDYTDYGEEEEEENCELNEFCDELSKIRMELKTLLKEEETYWSSLDEEEQWNEYGESSYDAQSSIKLSIEWLGKLLCDLNRKFLCESTDYNCRKTDEWDFGEENDIWNGNEDGMVRVERLEKILDEIIEQRDSMDYMYNHDTPELFETIRKLSNALNQLKEIIEELISAAVDLKYVYYPEE